MAHRRKSWIDSAVGTRPKIKIIVSITDREMPICDGNRTRSKQTAFNFKCLKTNQTLSSGGWDTEANRDTRLSILNKSIV